MVRPEAIPHPPDARAMPRADSAIAEEDEPTLVCTRESAVGSDTMELPAARPHAPPLGAHDVEVTCDALPPELRDAPLPFVGADQRAGCSEAVLRVASVAAHLAVEPLGDVLGEHQLEPEGWLELERRTLGQILAAMERGDLGPRDTYDRSYLRARQRQRGALTDQGFDAFRAELRSGRLRDVSAEMARDVADAVRLRRSRASRRSWARVVAGR